MLRAGVLAPNPQLELLPTSRPPRYILIETGVLGMEHWTQTFAKSFSAVRAHCRATAKARPSSRLVRWNDFVLYCGSCAAHCAHGGCALPAAPKLGRPSLGHDPGLRPVGSEHTTHGDFCCLRREGGGQRRAACWGCGQHLHRRRQAISLLMQPRTAPYSFQLGNLSL